MAPSAFAKDKKKRKIPVDDVSDVEEDLGQLGLEMASEDEGSGDEGSSSEGEQEEFPELHSGSDTDDTSEAGDDEESDKDDEDTEEADEDEGNEEDEESDEGESEGDGDGPARRKEFPQDDAKLRRGLAPEMKTVISDITGVSKRVYPAIEPDYDSDSSTEDVRFNF